VIDTHCHLTFPDFRARVPEVLAQAAAAGVTGCITIATTSHDTLEALALAKAHPSVWCSAGVHPLHAGEGPHNWGAIALAARDERCVAWGELGLDNHYPEPLPVIQRAVLDEQLDMIARAERGDDGRAPFRRAIVIHCREAFAELVPILARSVIDPTRLVFHCFTGTRAEALKVLDLGAMLSFTGVATYRNAAEVREAARLVPADRIMIETDAPYLSPEPVRSTRPCQPAFARHTALNLAALRGEPFDRFHEQINRNTERFFGIPTVR
jgi:TatD DNase family protein